MTAIVTFCVGAAVFAGTAHATIGMAEWEVYTPGGNLISHSDPWKEEHGTCLRSETPSPGAEAPILASHLARWRYYEGYVAGQDARGFFLFDESTMIVSRLASEAALSETVDSLGLTPISTWLVPGDGWQEAWFPFMTWRPCKILLGENLESAAAGLSPEQIEALKSAASRMFTTAECHEALQESRFAPYRRTTWGRECEQQAEPTDPMPAEQRFLRGFCDELLRSPAPAATAGRINSVSIHYTDLEVPVMVATDEYELTVRVDDLVFPSFVTVDTSLPIDDLRLEQQTEFSVTLMNEGPHIDLTSWEHGYSPWEELRPDGLEYRLVEQNQVFPEVTAAQLEQGVREELERVEGLNGWDLESSLERWMPLAEECETVREYPCAVGTSSYLLRISIREGATWRPVHLVRIEVPMGC